MTSAGSPGETTLAVAEVLEHLDIPYFVAGSLAAIVHGVIRTTMDADIVAAIEPRHVESLVGALDNEFFVDDYGLGLAVAERRQANLIHRVSMFKVDLYPLRDEPFHRSELARRVRASLTPDADRGAFFATAEDTVLSKLVWFRLGNEVSERQWRDVLGILKTQDDRLDRAYLRKWSTALSIDDLLLRAVDAATE